MYKLQQTPDKEILMSNGNVQYPVATLKDEYGGVSHIIMDDHCYVLVNKTSDGSFAKVYHWYREAAVALFKIIQGDLILEEKRQSIKEFPPEIGSCPACGW